MRHAPNSDALSSLLPILNDKKPEIPITSVVNKMTVDLIYEILSKEDSFDSAARLDYVYDARNLLDFLLHLLRNRLLPSRDDSVDLNQRARRFMFKVVSEAPVIPFSLIITGITAEHDYIGKGGFGRVHKGNVNGAVIALKMLYKSDDNLAFCREALMWGSLKHKFVLPFLGIYESEDAQFFLVSPYMANGTLAQWRKKVNPSISKIENRILEVAQGIEYIHSEGIVHGDLRGENVLLDSNLHIQIADFGLTRLSDATNTQSGARHLNFAAPELFGISEDSDDHESDDVPSRTQMSDVYAFGCLYYEIHYDSIPFAGKQEMQIMALLFQDRRPPRLDEPPLNDEAWWVIQRCWVKKPAERPSIKNIVEDMSRFAPRLTDVRNNEMLQNPSPLPSMSFVAPPRRDDDILPLLLSLLNNKQPGSSIASIINTTTINLMSKLLSREDYATIAERLTQVSDVQSLIDFMLHLLDERLLKNQDVDVNMEQRAKQFMFKLMSKVPVIPMSLIVTGISIPAAREYIGLGGFGVVFKGELRGSAVALKIPYRSGNSDKALYQEALMWQFLKHQFVLPFLGIYVDELTSQSFLVSPYMQNGNLRQWRRKGNLPMTEIQTRILEVAQGLEYIHSEGIVHGDICGVNVFLDANLHIQIASFASIRPVGATVIKSVMNHVAFAAPELFEIFNHDGDSTPAGTQMSDVYAFGCLYYETHHNKRPFSDIPTTQILNLITQGKRPPRLDEPPLSDEMWDLIQRCWVNDPSKRPRMKDVIETLRPDD